MKTLVLVRHGEAAAGWDADLDPGLSSEGRAQAEALIHDLVHLGPLPIVVSPLRRTLETAAALAARWGVEPRTEPGVGEIVAPADRADLAARTDWLRTAMAGHWSDLGDDHLAWRQRVLDRLGAIEGDAVVVSHFVAINVAVGEASGDDRVVCFAPGYCSRTVLNVDEDGRFTVRRLGQSAVTQVRIT